MCSFRSIVGDIVIGECVVVAAGKLKRRIVFRNVDGATEHEMFEEVCKSGALRIFVTGAYLVKDIDGGQRRRRILVDDQCQSVGQGVS